MLLYGRFYSVIPLVDGAVMQLYKRQYRELSDETKEKISAANRNRPKSEMHRQHISQAMKDYWAKVPHRPSSGDVTTYQG